MGGGGGGGWRERGRKGGRERERDEERGGEREGGREREREEGREREHGTMYYNHTMREVHVPVLIIYESYRPDALVRVIHNHRFKATTSLTAT